MNDNQTDRQRAIAGVVIEQIIIRPSGRVKWPWPQLKVSDALRVKDQSLFEKARRSAHDWGKRNNRVFRTYVLDNELTVTRVK